MSHHYPRGPLSGKVTGTHMTLKIKPQKTQPGRVGSRDPQEGESLGRAGSISSKTFPLSPPSKKVTTADWLNLLSWRSKGQYGTLLSYFFLSLLLALKCPVLGSSQKPDPTGPFPHLSRSHTVRPPAHPSIFGGMGEMRHFKVVGMVVSSGAGKLQGSRTAQVPGLGRRGRSGFLFPWEGPTLVELTEGRL